MILTIDSNRVAILDRSESQCPDGRFMILTNQTRSGSLEYDQSQCPDGRFMILTDYSTNIAGGIAFASQCPDGRFMILTVIWLPHMGLFFALKQACQSIFRSICLNSTLILPCFWPAPTHLSLFCAPPP